MQYFYMKKLEFDCEFDNTFWTIQYRKWSLYIWSYSIINQNFFYKIWFLALKPTPLSHTQIYILYMICGENLYKFM